MSLWKCLVCGGNVGVRQVDNQHWLAWCTRCSQSSTLPARAESKERALVLFQKCYSAAAPEVMDDGPDKEGA